MDQGKIHYSGFAAILFIDDKRMTCVPGWFHAKFSTRFATSISMMRAGASSFCNSCAIVFMCDGTTLHGVAACTGKWPCLESRNQRRDAVRPARHPLEMKNLANDEQYKPVVAELSGARAKIRGDARLDASLPWQTELTLFPRFSSFSRQRPSALPRMKIRGFLLQ